MKTKSCFRNAILIALAVFCLTATDTWAHPPGSRQLVCKIETMDRYTRTLTLDCDKEVKPLDLVWHDDTWFVQNQHFTNSEALKQGLMVRVYYWSPFFGKKFATRVVWANGSALNRNQKI